MGPTINTDNRKASRLPASIVKVHPGPEFGQALNCTDTSRSFVRDIAV